jgi:serine/threonine protein kinase
MTNDSTLTTEGDGLGAPSGLVFNKYRVIRRLALGGMGEVFLARQTGVAVDRLVILKSLLPELAEQEGFIDQFLDEARVAATLNHPNIVAIYEVGLWNGMYFIAMEYIHGTDLSRLQRSAAKAQVSIPFQISARIIHDAALGLHHAHTATGIDGNNLSIVHRDISPQNIMVRGDGVVKVVDFGIAKASNRSTRTATGMLKGKLQYMSPEQLQSLDVDGRSDQFALGVVLWELSTNSRLFKAENELKTLQKILNEPIPLPTSLFEGYPPVLEAVVMRMLARDLNDRYADCSEAATEIKSYLDSCSQPGGEMQTAKCVQSIVGEELSTQTKNITTSQENFMISLSGSHAEPGTPQTPTSQTSQISTVQKQGQRGVIAGLLMTVLFAVTFGLVWVFLPDDPATTARNSPPGVEKSEPARIVLNQERTRRNGKDENIVVIRAPVHAKVFVDKKLWPERVPTTLTGLSPGEHEIILELEDGERLLSSVNIKSIVGPPRLSLESRPAGAMVFLDNKLLGMTPVELNDLPADKELVFEMRHRGYDDSSLTVTLKAGKLTQEKVTLQKKKSSVRGSNRGKKTTKPTNAAKGESTVIEKEKIVYVKEKAAPVQQHGFFTLNTTPWAKVFIDGQPAGSTPLFKYKLSPGKHSIRLVNEGAGVRTSKTVHIKAGSNLKKSWVLQ